MKKADGQQLLAEYVQTGSEAAFRSLVECYIGLVLSSARRMVGGDVHLAEDITQIVFSDLARKARSLSKTSTLGGWLHHHTCYVSLTLMRTERRRHAREKAAMEITESSQSSDPNLAQIASVLDEAIDQLTAPDRQVILSRFFDRQDFRKLGAALGISEDAARMRLNRALEKLHELLGARAVALPVVTLGAVLASQSVIAAPVELVSAVTKSAMAGSASASGTAAGILKTMSLTKSKLAVGAALVATAVAAPLVLQHQSYETAMFENRSLRQQLAKSEILAAENQQLSNLVANLSLQTDHDRTQLAELIKLRGEVARLRSENRDLAKARLAQRAAGTTAPTNSAQTYYVRTYRVDPEVLLPGFKTSPEIPEDFKSIELSYQKAMRQLLVEHEIDIESPASAFMNVTKGLLIVRTSLRDLEKLDHLIESLADQNGGLANPGKAR